MATVLLRLDDAEVGLDHDDVTDLAGIDAPLHVDHRRHEPRRHRLHQEAVVLAGDGDHLLRLSGVEREGLLAQHVLAGAQCVDGHLVVWLCGDAT